MATIILKQLYLHYTVIGYKSSGKFGILLKYACVPQSVMTRIFLIEVVWHHLYH